MRKVVSELEPGDVVRFKDGDETVVSVTRRHYPASSEWGTLEAVLYEVEWSDGITGHFHAYEQFVTLT